MNSEYSVSNFASKLEGILRRYLKCGYNDFGVKANDKLSGIDWKSPINFALGHRYAASNDDPAVRERIEYFLGDELQGQSIGDVVRQYEYYGFDSQEAAFVYIDETIKKIEEILFS